MIETTFQSQSFYLLNDEPDWQGNVRTTWQLIVGQASSLSQREGRRPHSGTLRCTMQYQSTRSGAAARQLVGALRDYTTQPVLCPLWPAVCLWDEAGNPAGTGLWLVWRADWSQWEIFSDIGVEPSWPAGEVLVAPLLWGRLVKREVNWLSNEALSFDAQFEESGPAAYSVTPAAAAFPTFPLPPDAGYSAAPLRPFLANFTGVQDALNLQLVREQIGFTRDQAETFYSQAVQRETKVPFLLRGQAMAFLFLRFFLDVAGPGHAFWTPGWMSAAALTADVAAGDQTLHVTDTASVRAGDFIALFGGQTGESAAQALVDGVTDTTIHLASPLAVPTGEVFSARDTIITPLLLVRLDKPQMDIEFSEPDVARVSLQLVEVPPEYSPPSDEVLGSTLGQLPTRCWLYEFSRILDGVTFTDRYTSYESDLTLGGNTYASAKIAHGEIKQGLNLESDEGSIKSSVFADNPLILSAQLRLESPLRVVIRAAEVAGPTAVNDSVLFSGEMLPSKVKGARLTATTVALGRIFDDPFPDFFLQATCNYALFEDGCGLLASDWKFTATLQDVGTVGYPFSLLLRNLARVTGTFPASIFAGWFVGGWLEYGAGLTWQRRAIVDSTAYIGSPAEMTIWLDRDLDPYPTNGQAVALFPGCDGRRETCQAYHAVNNPEGKFDNYLNFGGHPFIPASNPSLVKLPQPTAGGKK